MLFVGHHAHRNGAPIVLLNLLRWIKVNEAIQFELLLKASGDLAADHRKLSPVHLWSPPLPQSFIAKNLMHIANRLFLDRFRRWRIVRNLKAKQFDLIYANTLDTTDLVRVLGETMGIPCICHVHELDYTIRTYCGPEKLVAAKPYITSYIAVAEAVKKNLVLRYDIPANRVQVIPPPIDVGRWVTASTTTADTLPDMHEPFLVVSSGLAGWRKGTDLFLLVAKLVLDLSPQANIRFRWVGHVDDALIEQYRYDIETAGLCDQIEFTGQLSDPTMHYRLADLFVLTSREDPFPLVCMESAALGKPLLCFDAVGGIAEFIQAHDAGSVVPYLSLLEMAQLVLRYAGDRTVGAKQGQNGNRAMGGYDLPVVAARIVEHLAVSLTGQWGPSCSSTPTEQPTSQRQSAAVESTVSG